jgi:hypothetical protein
MEGNSLEEYFYYHDRLGIHIPIIDEDWDSLPEDIRQCILLQWETIRGMIPDRIISLEKIINMKQVQLSNETNFELSCQLNHEIADLASIINDLWLWFRKDQTISEKMHQ